MPTQPAADIRLIHERIQQESGFVDKLLAQAGEVIVGQRTMIERLLIGLITGGHVLLEGVPGLAKTLTVKTLADCLRLSFKRIQFTPDLLPADLVGTQIYQPQTQSFTVKKGPLFANLILADEINRAPAKVQSALLESMQEKQVTIGDQTFPLPRPFLVLATENPIEQEGTYPLPEAQVDRFMLKVKLTYPSKEEEFVILNRMSAVEPDLHVEAVLHAADRDGRGEDGDARSRDPQEDLRRERPQALPPLGLRQRVRLRARVVSGAVRGIDHVALPMRDADAMIAFYRSLGLDVDETPHLVVVHVGDQMINKTPESHPTDIDVTIRRSDMERIQRWMAQEPVTLEFNIQNRWLPPIPQYNVATLAA